MGVVYEAFDTERGTPVALKTLRNLDAASLLRFKAEFRALADIHHENLVRFGELLEHEGRYFFTMELVRGGDFLSYVRPGIASDSIAMGTTENQLAAETLPAVSSARGSVAGSTAAGKLDEPRLRAALAQLAAGLAALHAAGKVHRDVKPTNVLVQPEHGEARARVVLVDFGLVTDTDASQGAGEGIAGTIAYMAPEQAAGDAVGPAADWYAVGAMLYEALTGQVPFFGSAYEVLTTKRSAVPPRPRDAAPDAPADLDALCTELLQPDPSARPRDDEVLARLGVAPAQRASLMPPSGESPPFVGRRRELDQLQRAYEQARRGTSVTVYVHGESGLGKTALARHFVARMAESDRSVVVLTGRCYERESVPYKAVDGVIDALGRWLARVPRAKLASMLPASATRLGSAFPVLERLRVAQRGEGSPSSALDPLERRARVFHAMRELLHALAEERLVVMLIDDLQWADADSLLLLREVMRSPPASILLVATVRTESETAQPKSGGPPASLPASRLNVGSSAMPGDVRIVHLDPLGESESRALAEALIERAYGAAGAESTAGAIVREAGGHPLFIDELVRHAWIDEGRKRRSPVRLEDALWSRIRAADDLERRLLEVLAVARGPLAYDAAAAACGLERASALDEVVAKLRFERLVRTTRLSLAAQGARRDATAVETYHDRVRLAVLAHLEAPEPAGAAGATPRAAEIHSRIAAALESSGDADLEALAEHHRGAGDLDKASDYATRAARAAAEQLAFDRAARLYEWAMAMRPATATKESLVALAEALASAGRGPAAAEAYGRAAKLESVEEDALELRRLAAHHLLTTGHTREGLEIITDVMRALDLELAASPGRALLRLGAHRARLRLRGLSTSLRASVPRRDLARVDACFTASAGLAHTDPLRGAELQSRGLLLALSAGEPSRVARALANEAAYVAMSGDSTRPRWTALLDRARELAAETGDARLLAHALAGEGVALHLSGYWLASRARCEDALRLLREHAPSSTWEIDATTLYSLRSLLELGQLGAVRSELPERLADAETRGDCFAQNSLRTGELNLVWLARDDVEGARREVAAAERDAGTEGLPLLHSLVAQTRIDLYAGEPARAQRRVVEQWPAIERSELLRIQHQRVTLLGLRARVALAGARLGQARAMLDEAAGFTNELARTGVAWALADAALLRGCIGQALGDSRRAAVSFDQATRDFGSCDMTLHAAIARLRFGKIVGGDEGRAAVGQSREWMAGQGVADPDAFVALVAP